ncbi:lytic transglycosylase domain-containing protein [Erythrobacter sp. THAF29]|uniref:lytic transglycosylase domain-containing protein n=1 Tax=Erythrobacter sp. THAF29 TaxID=2587851 RepID=UPI0012A84AC5|nr:lytic transglycosylase domain-containing protein [Erythrobacter sp. THAF29]QFT78602.1 Membrane-bound lytic murein transglycosylase F precursor [Erythrobacter sp. THAF29]
MILARAGKTIIAASFAVCAIAAQADVMEVDGSGARWVAGGLAAPLAEDTSITEPVTVDMNSGTLPGAVVTDPASHARHVPARYMPKILELAQRFDLSPSLLEAVVWQESRWRENAVSPAGARGLAQLMPVTAKYLGVDPDDPHANLEGGARYLREQLDRFDGDLEKALAAYNAGPGRVIRAGGIPNIRETKQYVAAIMGRLASHSRAERQ